MHTFFLKHVRNFPLFCTDLDLLVLPFIVLSHSCFQVGKIILIVKFDDKSYF